jgi:hypothetical protein
VHLDVWFSGPHGPLDLLAAEWIRQTESTLWMACYLEPRGPVAIELARLAVGGKDVRLIMDADASRRKTNWPNFYVQKRPKNGRMHHKFMVRDGSEVLASSYNFTQGKGNADFMMSVKSRPVVSKFRSEFLRLEKLPNVAAPLKGKKATNLIRAAKRKAGKNAFISQVEARFKQRGFLTVRETAALRKIKKKK